MKKCPVCGRAYTDENIFFCLDDGAPLAVPPSAEKTLEFSPAPTQNFQPSPFVNQKSNRNGGKLWIIPVVGILIFILFGGVLGAFFLLRSRPSYSPNTNLQTAYNNNPVNSRASNTPAPSPTIDKPPSAKLVGTWEAEVVEQGAKMSITYKLNADGTSRMFFKNAKGQTGSDYGTWQYSDGVLYEKFSNGASGKGALRMIDDNTFEITIIDNGTPAYTGVKRIYRRK